MKVKAFLKKFFLQRRERAELELRERKWPGVERRKRKRERLELELELELERRKRKRPELELERELKRELKRELERELELELELELKRTELEPELELELKRELERELKRELKRPELELRELKWREQLHIKDSWVRRLRLDEAKDIRRGSFKLAVTITSIGLIGSIGVYFDIFNVFSKSLATGIGAAAFLWFLISYGDHGLRKTRVRNDWYGGNAMEIYELVQFIKKTAENNGGEDYSPRIFFGDPDLPYHAKKGREMDAPSGAETC